MRVQMLKCIRTVYLIVNVAGAHKMEMRDMLVANDVAIGDLTTISSLSRDRLNFTDSQSDSGQNYRLRSPAYDYNQIIHGELLQFTLQSHALHCIVSSKFKALFLLI